MLLKNAPFPRFSALFCLFDAMARPAVVLHISFAPVNKKQQPN